MSRDIPHIIRARYTGSDSERETMRRALAESEAGEGAMASNLQLMLYDVVNSFNHLRRCEKTSSEWRPAAASSSQLRIHAP